MWGCPQDVIFQRPKDVGRERPQDVGRGRPLVLHKGPYGDVHRSSFVDVPSGNNLNGEEKIETFYEKELQKPNQQEFRIEKVIKRKRNKLHVKWKDYDNLFNSWIDKNGII